MFAVYNYEVSDNVYIFDSEAEAQRCECLLSALNSYNDNTKECDVTFIEELDSYEAIKNSQIEVLEECGGDGGEVWLIYNGEAEVIRI